MEQAGNAAQPDPSPRRARALTAAWAALVVIVVLIPFLPVLRGERSVLYRDTDRLYAPLRPLVVEALRSLRLPLWNPYAAGGKPLFAEGIHGVLHPISVACALLAPDRIEVLLLAYLVAAALGAMLLARAVGCSRPAAAAAGIAYALGGFTLSMTGNLVFLAGAASAPWAIAGIRCAGAGRRLGIVCAAAAVASALLSGDTQVAIVASGLGLALAAEAGGRVGVRHALLGIVIGGLLAGVQVAASWGELRTTYRGVALLGVDAQKWALSPWRLPELVAPGFFQPDPSRIGYPLLRVADPDSAHPEPFADSIFIGAAVLALAALAPRGRVRRVLGVATLVLLWLALGHRSGARQILGWIPVWGAFRYAEKLVGPLTLCVALLAGLGLDASALGLSGAARRGLAVALGMSAVLAAGLLLWPWAFVEGLSSGGVTPPAANAAVASLSAGVLHALAGVAGVLAVLLLVLAGPSRGSLLAAIVALQSLAAAPFGRYLGPPRAEAVRPFVAGGAPPGPRLVQVGKLGAVLDPAFVPGLPAQDDVAAMAFVERTAGTPMYNVRGRLDSIDDYSGFESRRHLNLQRSFGERFALAARRFATTHVVVTARGFDPEVDRLAPLATAGATMVAEDPVLTLEAWAVPHRPWAFFADAAIAADHPARARDVLLDLVDRGEDRTVVVEAPSAPPCAPGAILRVARRTDEVRIEAESERDALLVVNDAFWPGWKATIDGVETPIFAADVLVRAVRWPAGRHVLHMVYAPREVAVGWGISAAGVVALAAVLIASTRRLAARWTAAATSDSAGRARRSATRRL